MLGLPRLRSFFGWWSISQKKPQGGGSRRPAITIKSSAEKTRIEKIESTKNRKAVKKNVLVPRTGQALR